MRGGGWGGGSSPSAVRHYSDVTTDGGGVGGVREVFWVGRGGVFCDVWGLLRGLWGGRGGLGLWLRPSSQQSHQL